MAIKIKMKKWGHSYGAVFPREFIKEWNIKENEEFYVEPVRVVNVEEIRRKIGLPKKKINAQKLKDMAREGWL
jgi:antitoxin component of MazEF toxin-antitoxin module